MDDGGWRTSMVPGAPRLAIDEAGQGTAVVFLHGVGGNRTNWHDQLPVFARHFHAAAWDARGYGGSDDYSGPLSFPDFSHDLRRLLDYLGGARAHLVGLSMGGMIAQDFYRLFPERVLSLVLVDTNNGLRRSLSPEQIANFVKLRRDPLLAGKTLREMAPPVARALSGPKATPETIRRLEESMAALHTESYVKTLEEMARYDGFPDLATVRVPTLVVVGEADRLTPPRDAEAMIAAIPGAEYCLIPQAGHLSNIEDPDRFNSVVLEFLLRRTPEGLT